MATQATSPNAVTPNYNPSAEGAQFYFFDTDPKAVDSGLSPSSPVARVGQTAIAGSTEQAAAIARPPKQPLQFHVTMYTTSEGDIIYTGALVNLSGTEQTDSDILSGRNGAEILIGEVKTKSNVESNKDVYIDPVPEIQAQIHPTKRFDIDERIKGLQSGILESFAVICIKVASNERPEDVRRCLVNDASYLTGELQKVKSARASIKIPADARQASKLKQLTNCTLDFCKGFFENLNTTWSEVDFIDQDKIITLDFNGNPVGCRFLMVNQLDAVKKTK